MYKVTTAPVTEPLSATDVKNYLKVEHTADDDLIDIMIQAAREYVENHTGRALMTQTIREYFDAFPTSTNDNPKSAITLRFSPVSEVTDLDYTDAEGQSQSLTIATQTTVDKISEPTRIFPAYNTSWPDTRDQANAVEVEYTAGYSSASDVPAPIRQAMLLIIAKMYESREDTVKKMPTHAEWLLARYKIPHILK